MVFDYRSVTGELAGGRHDLRTRRAVVLVASSLEALAAMVKAGKDFAVYNAKGEDITRSVPSPGHDLTSDMARRGSSFYGRWTDWGISL